MWFLENGMAFIRLYKPKRVEMGLAIL